MLAEYLLTLALKTSQIQVVSITATASECTIPVCTTTPGGIVCRDVPAPCPKKAA